MRISGEVNDLVWKKAIEVTGLFDAASLEEVLRELIDLAE